MWRFNEESTAAELFFKAGNVEKYDKRMSGFRDIQSEVENALAEIELRPDDVLLEFGCGTSELSIRAATKCRRVIAVDISEEMLDYSRKKAESRGVFNIDFVRAGFLSYEHKDEKVDKIMPHRVI